MKVICIRKGVKNLPVWPEVGNEYSVKRIVPQSQLKWKSEGEFYELTEITGYAYRSTLFAPLSGIDETELVSEEFEEKYCVPINH
jgi:hypothetical protein